MNTSPEFQADSQRDATDSIRGYVYQIYQSVWAWMRLKEDEILVLEGAEDFDVHADDSVDVVQVKDVSGNLTLRSEAAVDALNNYWTHRKNNPDYEIFFRFLTTANAGQEQGAPFGPANKGVEYWNSAAVGGNDIEPLRTFLLTLTLNTELSSFIRVATGDEFREKFVSRIRWDIGNKSRDALQIVIEDKLKVHGLKLRINSHDSCQALPHLLKKVADLLSTKGLKRLTFGDFISSFDDATTISIPRGAMEAMISNSSLQQIANMVDMRNMAHLTHVSYMLEKPTPIVAGAIERTAVVSGLMQLLKEQRIIFLYGSSGLGKTTLATLLSLGFGANCQWIGFRAMQPDQIKDLLSRISFAINNGPIKPFLVLDDIDLSHVTIFEREFISLVFSVINSDGIVIVTGPVPPPLQILPKLWIDEACEVAIPYFEESDVAEMIRAHGLTEDKRVSAWARIIWLTTSGHPQLVHARVRNLNAKGWPQFELSDFTKPEDVERIRAETRSRLLSEFPTENTRLFAYRLSLINGAFSRETALAVADTPPPIKLPGEAFDALIGPWIEMDGNNGFRVSPLLTGAANNVLSKTEVRAVHGAIALSILKRKSINQFEVSTAFFHAFLARQTRVLVSLSRNILTIGNDNLRLLYGAMDWLTLLGLEKGQNILDKNPHVELILRLTQFKLVASSSKRDNLFSIIERIEETLSKTKPKKLKQKSEALAYGIVLNNFEVPIPSAMVINMLSRLIDLCEEDTMLKEIAISFENNRDLKLPRLGSNQPAQVLFSYQGVRLSGLDDLRDLIESLDKLTPQKRNHLLAVCASDVDFAHLLITRAWWKEVKGGSLDVNKALQILDFTAVKARAWKAPEISKACLVAMSVIHDEYGHSIEQALEILNKADVEFPDDVNLINQRAKVFFHAGRGSDGLPLAQKTLEMPGLSNVEFVFCCRVAGIAAATLNDWVEAERLFLLGAEKAAPVSVQVPMGIGLKADAAFALWKQKKYGDSLSIYADVLDSLRNIPLSDDIRLRHLHATVRHSISWIHFDARGDQSTDLAEPLPGMCSNQAPHEGMKNHRIVDISAAWNLLAATEQILKLNFGIESRSKAATDGKKTLLMEIYARGLKFDSVYKNKEFDKLIPPLIGMLEANSISKMLREGEKDGWDMDAVPNLPAGYWILPETIDTIFHLILAASVIYTANDKTKALPIERWRSDLSSAGALSSHVDNFLNVLGGGVSDASLYQKAASAVLTLRSNIIQPTALWMASFRLLNAFMNERSLVETSLVELLTSRWLYAVTNQRFAFSTPSSACPAIEQFCLNTSLSGLAKIAAILDASAPYLNMKLSEDAKKMIDKIKTGG